MFKVVPVSLSANMAAARPKGTVRTITNALTAAETGHLVFGTLMTGSAHKTIDRIIDSYPSTQQGQVRTMLSESLRAILCQKLIPTVDGRGLALATELLIGRTTHQADALAGIVHQVVWIAAGLLAFRLLWAAAVKRYAAVSG